MTIGSKLCMTSVADITSTTEEFDESAAFSEEAAKGYDEGVQKDFETYPCMKSTFTNYIQLVKSSVTSQQPLTLLDIGCGPANSFEFYATNKDTKAAVSTASIIAIEPSQQMRQLAVARLDRLKSAGSIGNFALLEGTFESVMESNSKVAADSVNGATCNFVVHLYSLAQLVPFLTLVTSTIADNGVLYLSWWEGEEGKSLGGDSEASSCIRTFTYHSRPNIVEAAAVAGLSHIPEMDEEGVYNMEGMEMPMGFGFFTKKSKA